MDIDHPTIIDYEDGPDDSIPDRPMSELLSKVNNDFRLSFCRVTNPLPHLIQSIIWDHVIVDNAKNMFSYNLS